MSKVYKGIPVLGIWFEKQLELAREKYGKQRTFKVYDPTFQYRILTDNTG